MEDLVRALGKHEGLTVDGLGGELNYSRGMMRRR
jgi:hypothetical protein